MLFSLAVAAVTACIPVEGDRVTAADLARVAPEFSSIASSTEVAHAPLPGVQRVFTVPELRRIAERAGIALDSPAQICVERATQSLDADSVRAAMRSSLPSGEVEIEIVKISRSLAPKGALEFPISGLRPLSSDSDTARWQGRIAYDGRTLPLWALVRVRGSFTRLVAKAELKPGVPLTETDIGLELREGAMLGTSSSLTPADVLGLIPRKSIRAGAAIMPDMLDRPVEIARGDEVLVSANRGGILLRVSGVAESSGRRGDQIVVRNANSGKRFRARVQGKGVASL